MDRRSFVSGSLIALAAPTASAIAPPADAAEKDAPQRARYLITVADDFVVDVYHNGKVIPEAKRTMLEEKFGATAERVDLEVHKGDWLVFNVVNNRLRWGGASYFGLAGCFAANEISFVSSPEGGQWSACDQPKDVERFIQERGYLRGRSAHPIANPWDEGANMMRVYAGTQWSGAPIWGTSRNTWLKLVVE